MINFGSVPAGAVLPVWFSTYGKTNGESITLTGLAVTDIEIYKGTSMTQRASDAGYTLLDTDGIDVDTITGIHAFSIDTGDNTDAGFYAVGSFYTVVVSAVTVDSQTVNFIAATFNIRAAESVAGYPVVDAQKWLGGTIATPTVAGVPEVDITHYNGTAGTFASGRPEVNVSHWKGTAAATVDTAGYPVVTVKDGTGAGEIATTSGAIDTVTDVTTKTGYRLSATGVDDIWDEAQSGHTTAGTFGKYLDDEITDVLHPTVSGRTLDVTVTGGAGIDWGNVENQSTSVNLSATTTNLVNTATTLTNAPSDSSGVTTLLSRLSAARATKLDAISLRDATAQAGAAGSITLDASASATDNLYNGLWVVIESGTGAAQARLITGYTGSTKVATVAPNWTTNPASDSVFALVPAAKISGVTLVDTLTTYTGNTVQTGDAYAIVNSGTHGNAALKTLIDTVDNFVDTEIADIQSRLPAALVGGRMDANVGAISTDATAADNLEAMLDGTGGVTLSAILGTDAITATTMATGSIDALAFATDAVDEIAAAILTTPSQKLVTDASGRVGIANVGGDTTTVTNMVRTFRALIIDSCTSGSTTTSVKPANIVGTVADQYKGRIITFRDDTTTAALRGQQTDITASSAATPTILTVTALTTAPSSGDTFTIN